MAEVVFGVVAGALTVAEVTAKLGYQVSRAQQLWQDAKNAPEAVKSLMNRICLFQLSLSELQSDYESLATASNSPVPLMGRITSTCCHTALQELSASLDELSAEVNSKKRFKRGVAKMKISLEKDFLVTQERHLATSVQMLDMAHNRYMSDLMRQQPDRTVSLIKDEMMEWMASQNDTSISTSQQVDEPAKNETEKSKVLSSSRMSMPAMGKWLRPSFFGGFTWRYASASAPDGQSLDYTERQAEMAVQIRSPSWISQKAFDMIFWRSYSGFDFHSRVYSVVPRNAPVFKRVERGDVKGMQQLFSQGLASPFDRNELGKSLLQAALHSPCYQNELIPMLIRCGLDLYEIFDFSVASFVSMQCVLVTSSSDYNPKRMRDLHDLALAEGVYEHVAEMYLGSTANLEHFYLSPFSWLLSNPTAMRLMLPYVRPEHYQLPAIERLSCFCRWGFLDKISAEGIRLALREDSVLHEADVQELESQGFSLLAFMAMIYGSFPSRPKDLYELRNLNKEIMATTKFPHSKGKLGRRIAPWSQWTRATPLLLIVHEATLNFHVFEIFREWRKEVVAVLRLWLEDTALAGLDLSEYGREEKRLFLQMKPPIYCCLSMFYHIKSHWGLAGFTYGSAPEDWRFTWDLDAERLVGIFWEMIERPQINIPGAWVDDHTDTEEFYSSYESESE